jgi:hypothetical protein
MDRLELTTKFVEEVPPMSSGQLRNVALVVSTPITASDGKAIRWE